MHPIATKIILRKSTKKRLKRYFKKFGTYIRKEIKEIARGYWLADDKEAYHKKIKTKYYHKEYNAKPENKERIKQRQKEYNAKPEVKERERQYNKEYNEDPENKERQRQRHKEYNAKPENKERIKQYNAKPENKERIKQYNADPENKERINHRHKERYATGLQFRLRYNVANSIRQALKKRGIQKTQSCMKYIDCTIKELQDHLEAQGYSNLNKPSIDHIIPQSLYDFTDPLEIKKCWNLRNLRALELTVNQSKNDTLDMDLINQHTINDLLPKPQ